MGNMQRRASLPSLSDVGRRREEDRRAVGREAARMGRWRLYIGRARTPRACGGRLGWAGCLAVFALERGRARRLDKVLDAFGVQVCKKTRRTL